MYVYINIHIYLLHCKSICSHVSYDDNMVKHNATVNEIVRSASANYPSAESGVFRFFSMSFSAVVKFVFHLPLKVFLKLKPAFLYL